MVRARETQPNASSADVAVSTRSAQLPSSSSVPLASLARAASEREPNFSTSSFCSRARSPSSPHRATTQALERGFRADFCAASGRRNRGRLRTCRSPSKPASGTVASSSTSRRISRRGHSRSHRARGVERYVAGRRCYCRHERGPGSAHARRDRSRPSGRPRLRSRDDEARSMVKVSPSVGQPRLRFATARPRSIEAAVPSPGPPAKAPPERPSRALFRPAARRRRAPLPLRVARRRARPGRPSLRPPGETPPAPRRRSASRRAPGCRCGVSLLGLTVMALGRRRAHSSR